jgi:large subunit ribosomal protein L7Ae
MAEFVKVELTEELKNETLDLLEKSQKGKVKGGVNEVTKAIERGVAKFVVIAEDVSPAEIVMHLPILCTEKQIPFSYVPTKQDLGQKSGLGVATSAVAIIESPVDKELAELGNKISELKK